MLELRNITKIYHSKSGNEVKALDNVSVTFPETGMVFVLGKSGSGKSTLLNVIGGLDSCDSGEFVIKGKSSKDFAGSDFDAYRNTFIGFIFQEYNILDDFTVGANIGLALELQGKKATNEKITEILTQVELAEYARRKPNELSGGQKQRIAIARALVKDPEIIMADEPTGALDSNTGKQIFDTLKQLSKNKLVIIVSHDRDFAERYADRIIEMKDGYIESDVTKHEVDAKSVSSGILQMNDNLLKIEKGYQLTAKDVELINEYLRTRETDIIVSGDKRLNDSVRNVAGISQDNKSAVFDTTDPSKDVPVKTYDGRQTRFIRSSLPMKNAVKMGSNSLGHKTSRLLITILLSLIAFALFGFADTLGAYDKITAATSSIVDTGIKNASFTIGVRCETWSKGELQDIDYDRSSLNLKDLEELNKKFGVKFTPIFTGIPDPDESIDLSENMYAKTYLNGEAYKGKLYGFANIADFDPAALGFEVTGTLPSEKGEIAISKFMYEQFKANGFRNSRENEEVLADNLNMNTGNDPNSIIGKHLTMDVGFGKYTFKITAVIDTMFEYDRYQRYIPDTSGSSQQGGEQSEEGNALIDMVMLTELGNTLHYGYHCLGYVTDASITEMSDTMKQWWSEASYLGESMYYWSAYIKSSASSNGGAMMGKSVFVGDFEGISDSGYSRDLNRVGTSELIPLLNITWFDSAKTTLGENEMIIGSDVISNAMNSLSVDVYPEIIAIISSYDEYDPDNDFNLNIENIAKAEYTRSVIAEKGEIYDLGKEHAAEWGYGSNPTDEQIYTVIYNNIPWQYEEIEPENWRSKLPNVSMLKGTILADIAEDVLEINLDDYPHVPVGKYADIFSFYPSKDKDGNTVLNVSGSSFFDYYRRLVAYNAVFAPGATIHTDDDFINSILPQYGGISSEDYLEYDDVQKKNKAADAYAGYLNHEHNEYSYGDITYGEINKLATDKFFALSSVSYDQLLNGYYLSTGTWDKNGNEIITDYKQFKIVGIYERTDLAYDLVISDTFYNMWCDYRDENGYYYYKYASHEQGIYAFAIAPMGTDTEFIRKLVEESYNEDNGTRFELQNQVMDTLGSFNGFIETCASVFIYVGLGFALFASLMMMNFISTSISYKRREIGILRAVGAKSSDVFKIFFSEALIIALINYVLSIIATIAATSVLNFLARQKGLNVTLLNFGIRQIVLMLAVSVFVAAISSFLPVWNIAKRKPVDAIKNT